MSYMNAPYPQYPQHLQHTQHTQPPARRNTWKVVLISLGVTAALCAGGTVACTALVSTTASEVDRGMKAEQSAKRDGVKITKCDVTSSRDDIFPHINIDLEIVNTTKDQQTYFMDLFIKDEQGTRVANGSAMVTDVRPGQKVQHTETVSLTKALAPDAKVTCTIDKIS